MDAMWPMSSTKADQFLVVEKVNSDASTELGSEDSRCEVVEDVRCSKNLSVFDWDDTLFATTWLQHQGLLEKDAVLSEAQWNCLQRLAVSAAELVTAARLCGKVIIVTNAEQGWVESSCQRFLPTFVPILADIPVVSARSTYEQHGIFAPTTWKCRAFEDQIAQFVSTQCDADVLSIVSVGDSLHEQNALAWALKGENNCFAKALKFEECPDILKLIDEHNLVRDSLQDVVKHNGNLDLEVAVEVSPCS